MEEKTFYFHTKKLGKDKVKEEVMEDGSIKFLIEWFASTKAIDADGDMVLPEGIDMQRYSQNPIIKRQHKTWEENNIWLVDEWKITDKWLYIKGYVILNPEILEHKTIIHWLRHKFIKWFSIGFIVKEAEIENVDWKMVNVMKKIEILEISMVDIPNNPLTLNKAIKMAIKEMKAEMFKIGDFVEWNSSGWMAMGEVVDVEKRAWEGFRPTGSDMLIIAKENDPVAMIKLYRDWEETDQMVVHLFSTLSKAEKPEMDWYDEDKGEDMEENKKLEEEKTEEKEVEVKEKTEEKWPTCRQDDETKEECVERKIPELIDEWMKQDQAVAVANNMCESSCDEKEVEDKLETKAESEEKSEDNQEKNIKVENKERQLEKQLNEDTEKEIRWILDGKTNRVNMIMDLMGSDEFNEDTKKEIMGLIDLDNDANEMLLDLMWMEDDIKEIEEEVEKTFDNLEIKDFEEELNETFKAYHDAVNMSYSQLKSWSETECSKKASLSRWPINRNLELLDTPKSQWTEKHIKWANKTIAFIARMKANLWGERIVTDSNGRKCGTKAFISLKNWAYDANKDKSLKISTTKEIGQESEKQVEMLVSKELDEAKQKNVVLQEENKNLNEQMKEFEKALSEMVEFNEDALQKIEKYERLIEKAEKTIVSSGFNWYEKEIKQDDRLAGLVKSMRK